jgi:hypothetical protein
VKTIVFLLFCGFSAIAFAEDNTISYTELFNKKIIGPLGYPLGEYVTIEGKPCVVGFGSAISYPTQKDILRFGVQSLEASKVNGVALAKPVIIRFDKNHKYDPSTNYVIRGFQSGGFGGSNVDSEFHEGTAPQASFHFFIEFIPTRNLTPKPAPEPPSPTPAPKPEPKPETKPTPPPVSVEKLKETPKPKPIETNTVAVVKKEPVARPTVLIERPANIDAEPAKAPTGIIAVNGLIGKPVTALLKAVDQYKIEVSQPAGAIVITPVEAKYALEHSALLDPTLPEVRYNVFPLMAEVKLIHTVRTNETIRIDLCGGLGLYRDNPFTYVFRYQLPK